MAFPLPVQHCTLPVYDGVCFNLGQYYVTAQPITINGSEPWPQIASAAGAVVCVRDPSETNVTPPFDPSEAGELISRNVVFADIPLPHFNPAPKSSAWFNWQAAAASEIMATARVPVLVHCSTGDRASAAFAVHLILRFNYSNAQALDFATQKLALQNPDFKSYVANFRLP